MCIYIPCLCARVCACVRVCVHAYICVCAHVCVHASVWRWEWGGWGVGGGGGGESKRDRHKQTDSLARYTIEGSCFILNVCVDVRLQHHSLFSVFTTTEEHWKNPSDYDTQTQKHNSTCWQSHQDFTLFYAADMQLVSDNENENQPDNQKTRTSDVTPVNSSPVVCWILPTCGFIQNNPQRWGWDGGPRM